MLDFGGNCRSHGYLSAAPRLMDGLRHSVILIMLVALAGGVWTRHLYTYSGLVEIRPALENSELQET